MIVIVVMGSFKKHIYRTVFSTFHEISRGPLKVANFTPSLLRNPFSSFFFTLFKQGVFILSISKRFVQQNYCFHNQLLDNFSTRNPKYFMVSLVGGFAAFSCFT